MCELAMYVFPNPVTYITSYNVYAGNNQQYIKIANHYCETCSYAWTFENEDRHYIAIIHTLVVEAFRPKYIGYIS